MNKKLQSRWMLSSDDKAVGEGDHHTDKEIETFCANKNLASIFTAYHPNLVSVVMVLMLKYNMQVAVEEHFLDPSEKYIRTGERKENACDMKLVSPIMICGVGSIEKVLVAALQIFFFNGDKDGEGTDYSVYSWSEDGRCSVKIYFTFNGADVIVTLHQEDADTRGIFIHIEE